MELFKQLKNRYLLVASVAICAVLVAWALYLNRSWFQRELDYQALGSTGEWHFQSDPKPLNLVYFGYTRCPDLCPMTLAIAGAAFRQLSPDELSRVRLVFLDLDVEHDSAKIAERYAQQFFESFIGLVGSRAQIDAFVAKLGGRYIIEKDPSSPKDISINHTNRIYFLDRFGKITGTLSNPDSPDVLLRLMKEKL